MKKYFFGSILVVVATVCGITKAYAAPPPGFTDQTILTGLQSPIDYTFAPDGRIFIALLSGQILVYKNGVLLPTPALSLSSTASGIALGGERGLMSITLDPNFSSNGYIYLMYTTKNNHEQIARFTFSGDTIDPNSETVLLENTEAWSGFLDAGALRYNPIDGKLYATMGSNGEGQIAQDLSSLDGKLLRINLDGSIPPDNPFVSTPGAQLAIWSSGFRNPWHMNVDTQTGDVIVGDVGVNTWEKVVRSVKGANFGWPTFEGNCLDSPGGCNGITPPIYVYNHNGQSAAIDGGDVYKGTAFPVQYSHSYFYGDFVQGWIGLLNLDSNDNVISTSTFDSSIGSTNDLATFTSGPDGCMYYALYTSGEIHRICYTSPNNSGNNFTSTASTDSSSYQPSTTANITTTITSNQALNNVLIDTEIWSPSGKLSQNFTGPVTLPANTAYVTHWTTVTPQIQGSYTIKVGVFSSDWSTLYNWNSTAGNFSVSNEPPPEAQFSDNITPVTLNFNTNSSINLTSSLTANQSINNALLDLEIYDTDGRRVEQAFVPTSFTANQTQNQTWNFTAPSNAGNYSVKLGVFSSDWSHLYFWDNAAATMQITDSVSALSFVISTTLPSNTLQPGATTQLTTYVTATQNLSKVIIDTEVYNSSNNLVFQNIVPTSLVANQQFSNTAQFLLPNITGQYTVKTGIFSGDWSNLYTWQNRAAQFYIGTPLPPPTPGQTYPITTIYPQNNQSVSGLQEIKAVINGLDINTYTISWRTGNGSFVVMDPDPVTQAYQHAWIDFSDWTWNTNNIYPLEFQATDQSGNIIGNATINITVTH